MENVLVTGGLGFIGSNFIRYLINARKDIGITNLDYGGPSSNSSNLRDLRGNRRYSFVKGDITSRKASGRLIKTADYIVNFAAETHVDRSISDPNPFFHSNLDGVFNLLENARQSPIRRIVHISTDEVYGSTLDSSFEETDPLNPSSPYSATKAAADLLALAWNSTYKTPVVVLRCTNNFGPYQHPEKFIPKTIIRAMRGLEIPLYGGGRQVRDWIFVDDFCDAIEKSLDKGGPGEVYNISAGNELTNREVAERLLKLLDKPNARIAETPDRPAHDFRYSLSSKKAREQLGWEPMHSFDTALSLTSKWYQDNERWWKPLASSKILSLTPWKERW